MRHGPGENKLFVTKHVLIVLCYSKKVKMIECCVCHEIHLLL